MSSLSRSCAALVCALATLAAGTPAPAARRQVGPAAERPSGLPVDFSVVLADGTPVADLDPLEVEIRLDGRVRKVLSLRRVAVAPTPTGAAAGMPAPYGTNDSVAIGRSFLLVVDEESLVAGREQLLRNAVEGLLADLTPADQAMVVALPFGGVKTPFTSDRERIRRAMTDVAGQGTRTESGSDLACRTRRFLETLDGLLQSQAGRSSPLAAILFTAGLAAPRRDAPMALAPGMCELLVTHFQRITVTAGAARANVYVLQPADIGLAAEGWRESIAGANYLGSDNPLEGIEHLAGATGGVTLPLDATGTGSLRRAARESSAYYVAELEAERNEIFGRSRPLAVRVNRRGVTVRSRPEITLVDEFRRGERIGPDLPDLLASTEAFTDLPLRTAGFTVREPGGRLRVGVVVEPVEPAAILASAGAVLIDGESRVVARWLAPDARRRPILGAMAAQPGSYRLRVAAIDTAGRRGAAEDAVDATLVPVGPLSLGSLMFGVSRDDRVMSQLEFGTEPTAIASFDIYGGVAGMGLTATLELARGLDAPALVTLPLAMARADETRVSATGAVPIGALPPGDYIVRGIVRLQDGTTGRVVRTLRKAVR